MKKLFTLIAAALLAVGVNAQTRTTLWTSGNADGKLIDWGSAEIKINDYEPVAGDVIVVTVVKADKEASQYPQATLVTPVGSGWSWTDLLNVQMPEAGEYEFAITSDMIENISSHNQIFFKGEAVYISKVELIPSSSGQTTVVLPLSNLIIGWGGTSYTPVDGVCTIDTDHNVIGWWKSVDKTKYSKFVVELANVEKNEYFQLSFNGTDAAVSLDNGSYVKVIDLSSLSADVDRVMFQGKANSKFTIKQAYFATAEYVTENNITNHAVYGDTQDLGLGSLGSGAAQYDAATHTIAFAENATNKGWWYSSTTGADYSHFDNVVIEFDPATTAEGKVVIEYNGAESNSIDFNLGATCVVVPLNGTAKNNIKQIYIMGNPGVSVTLKSAYVAISSATPTANLGTPPTWTIAGSKLLVGSDWNTNDEKNNMTTTDNIIYTLVKENVTLEKGVDYKYKVVKNHSWDNENYGNGSEDAILNVTETAVYKVTFTFDALKKEITATAEKTGEAGPIEHTWAVSGSFTGDTEEGWKVLYEMTKGADGKYTVSIPVANAGDYEFKVRADGKWDSAYPAQNYKINIPTAGSTLVVTFDPETHEITATVTPPTGIEALTIDTDANAPMYNLAGQRVDKDYKGVVIKNGRKVVMK